MRKRHLFAIICILFASAAMVYYIAVVDVSEPVSVERDYRPSFIGTGLTTVVLDSAGQVDMKFSSKKMEYYRVSDTTYYDHPYVFRRFPEAKPDSWEISADQGYFNAGEFLSLNGNVLIKGSKKDSGQGGWNMRASYLQFDLNSHDISCDREVTISGTAGTENRCGELKGNLDTKVFNFKGNCNAVIYPEDFDNN